MKPASRPRPDRPHHHPHGPARRPGPPPGIRAARPALARIRHGRPARLALRLTAGLILASLTTHAGAGPAPAAGVITGLVTWLALTARGDLAPPPGR